MGLNVLSNTFLLLQVHGEHKIQHNITNHDDYAYVQVFQVHGFQKLTK
jgi:hypothetical protein